jgi:hypothetical protein
MSDENLEFSLSQGLMRMRVLWGALLVSQFLFLGTLAYLKTVMRTPPHSMLSVLTIGLGVLGIGLAIASHLLPKMPFRRLDETRPRPGDPTENEVALRMLPKAQTGLILGSALCESISLYGFALGFLGAEWTVVAPFFVAGVVLQLSRFPSVAFILGLMRE